MNSYTDIAHSLSQDGESIPALESLYCYLTAGCNLACRHCWLAPHPDPDGSRAPVLPLAAFETAVREALPLGLSGVKLTGGEPLLHPRIADILEVVRREGLALNVETNGVLCTAGLAAAIAAVPDRFVSVSIDAADAPAHDRARGVAGAFEAACAGVRALAAAGVAPQVVATLTRANAGRPQLEALVRLAEDLGASSVKLNLVQPAGRAKGMHQRGEVPGVAELIALGRWVEGDLVARTPLTLRFDWPAAFRPLSRFVGEGDDGSCRVLSILGLLPGGEYALCGVGLAAPGMVFGRAGTDALEEVWRRAPALVALREGLPGRLGGVCGRCLMRGRCLGACLAQNVLAGRSVWEPFWFCEQAAALGLFPASRLMQ